MVGAGRVGFGDVLRDRQFAVLYAAESQSILGDQLGRIALSVLVFRATGSIATTALTYAATFLPAIAGGLFVAGIGDRLSHRATMVLADLVRAVLFGVMALPGLPLPLLLVLVVVAVAVGPMFTAAEVSRLSMVLDGEAFRVAAALRLTTSQAAQVAGFALGGVLVAVVSPRGALLVNALTFALSALLIGGLMSRHAVRGTAPAPAGGTATSGHVTGEPSHRGARRTLWRDPDLRLPFGMTLLAGFLIVPEGLAVPLGNAIGASDWQTGLLLAAIPLGGVIGAVVLARWVAPSCRPRVAWAMAAVAGAPLVVSAWSETWWVVALLWATSGACAAYQIEVTTGLVAALPQRFRATLVGVVGAGLTGAQGVGVVAFGALAQGVGARTAVAVAGAVGVGAGWFLRGALLRRTKRDTGPAEGRPAASTA